MKWAVSIYLDVRVNLRRTGKFRYDFYETGVIFRSVTQTSPTTFLFATTRQGLSSTDVRRCDVTPPRRHALPMKPSRYETEAGIKTRCVPRYIATDSLSSLALSGHKTKFKFEFPEDPKRGTGFFPLFLSAPFLPTADTKF